MNRTFIVLAAVCLLSAGGLAQGRDSLESRLVTIRESFGGRLGVAAMDLRTGETIRFNADSLFPTASVIKLPVLVELYCRFHDRTLSPEAPVALYDSLKKPGSGVLQFLSGGQTLKLVDIATLMIVLSDNTATNYVIDTFAPGHDAKLEAVNSRAASLGLRQTKLLNKLYSFATKKKTEEARRFGVGVSSPDDMALLLGKIARGTIMSRSLCDSMIAVLRNQNDVTQAQRYLPFMEDSTLWVGNKTGSVDQVKNDVGIVSSSAGEYVYAIFCSDSRDIGEQTDNKATLAVASVSLLLYNHFLKK
jgi:beta-lactamase class A